MALMVNNKGGIGNPAHDESTGRFTSKNKSGIDNKPDYLINMEAFNKLSNEEILAKIQEIKNKHQEEIGITPKNLTEAEQQGNKIFEKYGATGNVHYISTTGLDVAVEYNKALKDVLNDFPELPKNSIIMQYGTGNGNIGIDMLKEYTNKITKIMIGNRFTKSIENTGISINDIVAKLPYVLIEIAKAKSIPKSSNVSGECFGSLERYYTGSPFCRINLQSAPSVAYHNNSWTYNIAMGGSFEYGDKSQSYATATHELGHYLHFALSMSDESTRQEINKLGRNRYALHKSGEISEYATTSCYEHIAEAVSDWYCRGENATPHNQMVFKKLLEIYHRIYGE